MISSRKRVSFYLAMMKHYAMNEFVLSPRGKNKSFLLEWAIDFETAKDIVLSLQVCDYVKGPCADDKQLPDRQDIWVFGKTLSTGEGTVETYIKVTVLQAPNDLGCLCISFHEAEREMNYVYGGDQREVYVLS